MNPINLPLTPPIPPPPPPPQYQVNNITYIVTLIMRHLEGPLTYNEGYLLINDFIIK